MYNILLYVFICSRYFGYDDIYKITANFEYGSESTAVPSPLTATILQSADKTGLIEFNPYFWFTSGLPKVGINFYKLSHARMFSRPKILFLVSLLFVALLNPKFNPYLLFKFLIFYHSSLFTFYTC